MFTLAQDACVPERSRELDLKAFRENRTAKLMLWSFFFLPIYKKAVSLICETAFYFQ